MNELAFRNDDGKVVTTSFIVSKIFHKSHKNVLRSIDNLSCSEEFRRLNFEPTYYLDNQKRSQPLYEMTKDGFTFLVMGFNGRDAGEYKEQFIGAFNAVVGLAIRQDTILKDDDAILAMAFDILTKKIKSLESTVNTTNQARELAEHKAEIISEKLERAKPKIDFADRIAGDNEVFRVGSAAKVLQLKMGSKDFFKQLRKDKILMDSNIKELHNEPYQEFIDRGYFVRKYKEIDVHLKDGSGIIVKKIWQTRVTSRGMLWLSKKYAPKEPVQQDLELSHQ